MELNEKLSKIQSEFKAKKSRYNSFGKYNFRSAEDILEGLKPFNEKYGVTFVITEALHGGTILESIATVYDNKNGEQISANAFVGIDFNQKGMQEPQKFGSASSYGKKYALGNLLLIDDTADADATNTHGKGQQSKQIISSKTDSKFKQAVEYIKKGGSLDAIKSKYTFSKEIEAELKKL